MKQKEKGAAEDEVIRQHHPLSGHESEQIPGDSSGQRSLGDTVHRCSVTKSCPTLCNPVDLAWGPQRVGHDLATGQHQQCVPLSSLRSVLP